MSDDIQYNLGAHNARIAAVETRIIELQDSQKEQTKMLEKLLMRNERVKGGLAMVVGASSFFGAVAGLIIEWVKSK